MRSISSTSICILLLVLFSTSVYAYKNFGDYKVLYDEVASAEHFWTTTSELQKLMAETAEKRVITNLCSWDTIQQIPDDMQRLYGVIDNLDILIKIYQETTVQAEPDEIDDLRHLRDLHELLPKVFSRVKNEANENRYPDLFRFYEENYRKVADIKDFWRLTTDLYRDMESLASYRNLPKQVPGLPSWDSIIYSMTPGYMHLLLRFINALDILLSIYRGTGFSREVPKNSLEQMLRIRSLLPVILNQMMIVQLQAATDDDPSGKGICTFMEDLQRDLGAVYIATCPVPGCSPPAVIRADLPTDLDTVKRIAQELKTRAHQLLALQESRLAVEPSPAEDILLVQKAIVELCNILRKELVNQWISITS